MNTLSAGVFTLCLRAVRGGFALYKRTVHERVCSFQVSSMIAFAHFERSVREQVR